MKFEWDPEYVPGVKLGIHSFQIIFSFVLWCLAIAVFTAKDAKMTGQNGWTFAVCFLSIPAWVFLIMTPRFSRTRRFAQPIAMLAVDAIFIVIWLSAFATQAKYNSLNHCGDACKLSRAIVAFGVFITLLFGASTFVSAYTLTYYNFHGSLPGYDTRQIRSGGENIDPDKAAFSMAPHDDEAYERVNMDDQEASGGHAYTGGGSSYAQDNPYGRSEDDDPDRYGALPRRNSALFDNSQNAYGSGGYTGRPAAGSNPYASQTSHEDEPAQFPSGDYDRMHR